MTEGGMEGALLAQFQYLLAGFVAAWVFYGLTPYKRPTPFERIVQALVYTAVVQLLTTGITDAARFVGWEWVGGFLLGPGGVFRLGDSHRRRLCLAGEQGLPALLAPEHAGKSPRKPPEGATGRTRLTRMSTNTSSST